MPVTETPAVYLRKISFGSPAAERDDNLSDYFVERDSYRRLKDGKKSILVGNRGVGKTALFRMLADYFKSNNAAVIELSPDDFSYEMLSQTLLREASGNWAKQSAYIASWKYAIYVMVMKKLCGPGSTGKLKRGASAKIWNYLRDNHKQDGLNPIAVLVSYLKRMEGVKLGRYEGSIKTRELQHLYRLEELSSLLDPLRSVTSKSPAIVLVDELDRGWDGSEDAKAFVGGLFHAAISIMQEVPGIRVMLSLRKELYNTIPAIYDDAQKVRDLIETIEWDADSLKDLISRRISASLGTTLSQNIREPWVAVFQDTLSYRNANSFNYMLDRTLLRPRELIQFCDLTRERAIKEGAAPPIEYSTISAAELDYSEMRIRDVASEYRFEMPGLDRVFETFRGFRYNLSRDDLESHLLSIAVGDIRVGDANSWTANIEPDEFIERLWRIGFIRARTVGAIKGRRRYGSGYLGSHEISSLNLDGISQFHVHPMFRSHLGLKEK